MAWRNNSVERGPRPKVYQRRKAITLTDGTILYRYVYISKSRRYGDVDLTCASGNPPPGFEVVECTETNE